MKKQAQDLPTHWDLYQPHVKTDFLDSVNQISHMGVVAHPDDLELLALDGIKKALENKKHTFSGVVVTNGGQSPREGRFKNYTNQQMVVERNREQKKAARIGWYHSVLQLGYSEVFFKEKKFPQVVEDLKLFLEMCRPKTIYTHCLTDKHDYHVVVALALVEAIRALPAKKRPRQLLGCEVWRGLDWIDDKEKVILDVSGFDGMAKKLMSVYKSQITARNRYDLAAEGRRRANAVFAEPTNLSRSQSAIYAVDMSLLMRPGRSIKDFVQSQIDRLSKDCMKRLERYI